MAKRKNVGGDPSVSDRQQARDAISDRQKAFLADQEAARRETASRSRDALRKEPGRGIITGLSPEMNQEWQFFREQLRRNHTTVMRVLPRVLDAIEEMLGEKDIAIRERGIQVWTQLQKDCFHQESESFGFQERMMGRVMEHTQKMASGGEEALEDWMKGAT